jgi:hypothetical protein
MANDEHVAILKKGVAAWNEWRDKNRGRPDLRQAELRRANLSPAGPYAGLIGADLSSADAPQQKHRHLCAND